MRGSHGKGGVRAFVCMCVHTGVVYFHRLPVCPPSPTPCPLLSPLPRCSVLYQGFREGPHFHLTHGGWGGLVSVCSKEKSCCLVQGPGGLLGAEWSRSHCGTPWTGLGLSGSWDKHWGDSGQTDLTQVFPSVPPCLSLMTVMLALSAFLLCAKHGARGFSWTLAPSDPPKDPGVDTHVIILQMRKRAQIG